MILAAGNVVAPLYTALVAVVGAAGHAVAAVHSILGFSYPSSVPPQTSFSLGAR
jgi:hypothetical protein